MVWFTQPFLSDQANLFLFPLDSVGPHGFQIETINSKTGLCFATHPLEMPRNFSKIFHIAIACGLITVSSKSCTELAPPKH